MLRAGTTGDLPLVLTLVAPGKNWQVWSSEHAAPAPWKWPACVSRTHMFLKVCKEGRKAHRGSGASQSQKRTCNARRGKQRPRTRRGIILALKK
jgi:hypothetical protein